MQRVIIACVILLNLSTQARAVTPVQTLSGTGTSISGSFTAGDALVVTCTGARPQAAKDRPPINPA
jgi:hypothetical protein